jgi:hypothetical protein
VLFSSINHEFTSTLLPDCFCLFSLFIIQKKNDSFSLYLVEGFDQENKPSLIRDKIRLKNLSMNGYHNINGKLLAKKII